jgi:hypothetical protein
MQTRSKQRTNTEPENIDNSLFEDRLQNELVKLLKGLPHDEALQFLQTVAIRTAKFLSPRVRLSVARIVAKDLTDWKSKFIILKSAERGDRQFFITLGKILCSEPSPEWVDPMWGDILNVLVRNPLISRKDAVRELEKRGWKITPETFGVQKQRIKRLAREMKKRGFKILPDALCE